MDKFQVNIQVKRGIRFAYKRDWVRAIVHAALSAENVRQASELGVVFTDDKTIQRLNKRYRFIDKPTDVLSFSLLDIGQTTIPTLPGSSIKQRIQLGEIIISYPRALEQCQANRVTCDEELALLLVHGVLHLLGYDHEASSTARQMRAREKRIMDTIMQLWRK